MLNLNDKMPNGATVSDFLGTAWSNAKAACGWISDARDGQRTIGLTVERSIALLESALSDLREVAAECDKRAGMSAESAQRSVVRKVK